MSNTNLDFWRQVREIREREFQAERALEAIRQERLALADAFILSEREANQRRQAEDALDVHVMRGCGLGEQQKAVYDAKRA